MGYIVAVIVSCVLAWTIIFASGRLNMGAGWRADAQNQRQEQQIIELQSQVRHLTAETTRHSQEINKLTEQLNQTTYELSKKLHQHSHSLFNKKVSF